MMIRFTQIGFLLLLPLVWWALAYSWKHVHGITTGRKRLAYAMRAVMLTLIVVALAGPEAHRPNVGLCTMFVVDRSDSISDVDRKSAEKFIEEASSRLGPGDAAGVIAFGKDAVIDASAGAPRNVSRILSQVNGESSDLAAAIRLASASFPDGKGRRIVVLSDGNETTGDASGAAEVAANDGIVIDTVPLGVRARSGEASVLGLEVPDQARIGQPFSLRVQVDSEEAQSAVVDIDRDGVLIRRVPVQLNPGRNSVVADETLGDPGFHRYRATLRAEKDTDHRNDFGMGFVSVRTKSKVLVLQNDVKKSELVNALTSKGIAVDLVGPAGVPSRPEDFQQYDAIIFNDINAANVTTSQMKLIQAAVKDSGVGFVMVGGENSYLPGGYYGTPIAELLPVDMNIRQRRSFPSTSVAIMIDGSGSMGMEEDGIRKIRLAGKAAEETVKMLSPMDRVGVAGSTDGIEFVAPMQPLTDKGSVISQIQKLNTGGGGIYVRPSMEKGFAVLRNEPSKVRHFILLADGSDCDEQEGSIAIALQMRAEHITTSVVAIGTGKDVEFCKALAAAGGGRFFLADRASQLPAIMTQDTAVISRSAIEEGAFLPKLLSGEEILKGIDSTPPLFAYCLADSRPLSRIGMKSPKEDPLLASWQYGLGTSVAFMSDAQSRWARSWVGWGGFSSFWAQLVRSASRRSTLNNYQVQVHPEGGEGMVSVKAFDRLGQPLNASTAQIRVAGPDGVSHDVTITQDAPGQYHGKFEASAIGSYIVTVAEPDPYGGQRVSSTGFSLPYPAEYRAYRTNQPLLKRLVATTGGETLSKPEQAARPIKNPGSSITELWSQFLFLAMVLLPLDIALRRLALPVAEVLAKLRARLRPERQPAVVAESVGRLQAAKQRAREDGSATTVKIESPMTPKPKAANPPDVREKKPSSAASSSLLEAKRKRQNKDES